MRVEFDSTGRHIATVNRLQHRTEFRYDSAGRVDTLTIPLGQRGFSFHYGADGRLERAESPGLESEPRVTKIHQSGLRVDSITDPDTTRIHFAYADTARGLVPTSRTNRLGVPTHFRFDPAGRVASTRVDPNATDSIVTRLRAVESLGLSIDGAGALDTARAYALIDGPRDVADSTRLWLNGWGAPRRIIDAVGRETVLARGDERFPALVTWTRAPSGLVTHAAYDARGNVDTVRVVNPYGPDCDPAASACDAVTRYEWDPRLDVVKRIELPEGEVTTFGYDTSGNRIWQQVGADTARRTRVAYETSAALNGLYSASREPGAARSDSVAYDELGNLRLSISAGRIRTEYWKDALGRDTLVLTQIDAPGAENLKGEVTPLDTTKSHRQRIRYRAASDFVERTTSRGPAMNGTPAQSVVVETDTDAEGRTRRVDRWSEPDTARIGVISTSYRYDAAGRRVAETAPHLPSDTLATDSTVYDPAGNVVEAHTRRRDPTTRARVVVFAAYDELNRVKTRTTPAVSYPQKRIGIVLRRASRPGSDETPDNPAYPRFPNNGSGYRIAGSVAQLDYDDTGGIERADNEDARVTRTYYPNGQLRSEVQQIRTVAGGFGAHEYRIEYRYDLNGRRTGVRHPTQLKPAGSAGEWTTYDYDSLGQLDTVTDALGSSFALTYTLRGDLETLTRPGGLVERWEMSADGLPASNTIRNAQAAYLRDVRFTYDGRGKLLNTVNSTGTRDVLTAEYSGLGHLVKGGLVSHGVNRAGHPVRYHSAEENALDALGNRVAATIRDTTVSSANFEAHDRGNRFRYQAGTGRLRTTGDQANPDTLYYDEAGNLEIKASTSTSINGEDRYSYYGADGKLRAADHRVSTASLQGPPLHTTFEEYWYDALGRRVLVRARRNCENVPAYEGECQLDKVRRTVWDGDQEFYEIQVPDGALAEADGPIPPLELSGHPAFDPNPFFGRVGYTHALGLDQPLAVLRFGYTDRVTGSETPVAPRTLSPFAIFPLWTVRGEPEFGAYDDGALFRCDAADPNRCVRAYWPGHWFTTERPKVRRNSWHGTLVEDKRDEAGTFYRRNRYLDPTSGRFTQEDPIGLAGGLNLYGFANGDPVGYSDPYGLCPYTGDKRSASLNDCPKGDERTAIFHRMSASPQGRQMTGIIAENSVEVQMVDAGKSTCPPGAVGCAHIGYTGPATLEIVRGRPLTQTAGTVVHETMHMINWWAGMNGSKVSGHWADEQMAFSVQYVFFRSLPASMRDATINGWLSRSAKNPTRYFGSLCRANYPQYATAGECP